MRCKSHDCDKFRIEEWNEEVMFQKFDLLKISLAISTKKAVYCNVKNSLFTPIVRLVFVNLRNYYFLFKTIHNTVNCIC